MIKQKKHDYYHDYYKESNVRWSYPFNHRYDEPNADRGATDEVYFIEKDRKSTK